MRLLIYLLAMLTGVSAAEAARPASAPPSTVGAQLGKSCVVIAVVSVEQSHNSATPTDIGPGIPQRDIIRGPSTCIAVSATTPVTRRDIILA